MFLIFKNTILVEIDKNDQLYRLNLKVSLYNKKVGKKGAIVFKVNENYNTDDINRIILFKKTILDKNNNNYEVGCGPWIYATRFLIFCEFKLVKIPFVMLYLVLVIISEFLFL